MGRSRAAWTTAIAIALVLLAAGAASAHRFRSCVSATGAGPCAGISNSNALANPSAAVVSPDGRHVYSAAFAGDAIATFARNPVTGALSFRGCVRGPDTAGPCAIVRPGGHVRAINGPRALVMSPDGKHLYVAAGEGDAIAGFTRNADTGALKFAGCNTTNTDGGGVCAGAQSGFLDNPVALAMAPDGDEVYVAGETQSSIGAFARNEDTGVLGDFHCLGAAPECADVPHANALATPSALVVSRDGRFVYAAARNGDAIAQFSHDNATDTLTYLGCVGAGTCTSIANANALDGPAALAVSSDNAQLFVAARAGNAIGSFTRNQTTGHLSFASCDGTTNLGPCAGIANANALTGPTALAVGPAGGRVYSAAADGDAIASFARAAGSNPLRFLGCVGASASGPCTSAGNANALNSPVALAASPDGRHLYSAAADGDALAVLGVSPPVCTQLARATPFQSALQLKLPCADPDGDRITYSAGQALNGVLSGLSATGGTVTFTPNPGFAGAGSFRFGASDIDGSATAGASIAVAAPPFTLPIPRITSPVSNRWAAGPRRTRIIRLRVRLVPAKATVEIRCLAPRRLGRRACPFRRKSARPRADLANVDLKRLFGRRTRLRVGVRLEIRITAPGAIGKYVRYKMRRSKLPRSVGRCLALGSTTPIRCS